MLRALSLLAGLVAPQDGGGAIDLTSRFAIPDGLAVTLWAESPLLYNQIGRAHV